MKRAGSCRRGRRQTGIPAGGSVAKWVERRIVFSRHTGKSGCEWRPIKSTPRTLNQHVRGYEPQAGAPNDRATRVAKLIGSTGHQSSGCGAPSRMTLIATACQRGVPIRSLNHPSSPSSPRVPRLAASCAHPGDRGVGVGEVRGDVDRDDRLGVVRHHDPSICARLAARDPTAGSTRQAGPPVPDGEGSAGSIAEENADGGEDAGSPDRCGTTGAAGGVVCIGARLGGGWEDMGDNGCGRAGGGLMHPFLVKHGECPGRGDCR